MLRSTKSVVSGLIAYAYMTPAELGDWNPNNLNLFVRASLMTQVISFLESCGYKCMAYTPVEMAEASLFCKFCDGYTFEVDRLKRGRLRIDIIAPFSNMSLGPVFETHSTIIMNFFTGAGFYSAYPLLTANQQAGINPNAMTIPGCALIADMDACLEKYMQRGVDMQLTPSAWSKCPHTCTLSMECLHTI